MKLKNGIWFDYGDAIIFITKKGYMDSEDAFYFYESCEDKGLFSDCESYDDVFKVLSDNYKNYGKNY